MDSSSSQSNVRPASAAEVPLQVPLERGPSLKKQFEDAMRAQSRSSKSKSKNRSQRGTDNSSSSKIASDDVDMKSGAVDAASIRS